MCWRIACVQRITYHHFTHLCPTNSQDLANCYALTQNMVNYLLKKYKTDQAIAENDIAVVRYVQPLNMTSLQYVDDLITKSCTVADVYGEVTLNDIFFEGVAASIRHGLPNYWASNAQDELTDIAFQVESLFPIWSCSGKTPTSNHLNSNPEKLYTLKALKSPNVASNANTERTSVPTWKTRRLSTPPQKLKITLREYHHPDKALYRVINHWCHMLTRRSANCDMILPNSPEVPAPYEFNRRISRDLLKTFAKLVRQTTTETPGPLLYV